MLKTPLQDDLEDQNLFSRHADFFLSLYSLLDSSNTNQLHKNKFAGEILKLKPTSIAKTNMVHT